MEYLYIAAFWIFLSAAIHYLARILPKERWQMLAGIPLVKNPDGSWTGLNLTWYGVFNAVAYTLGAGLAVVLLGAAGVNHPQLALLVCGMLGLCTPASKLIARVVEGKHHTLTVGGAAFTGILVAPWLAVLIAPDVPVFAVLAAMSIAYALGEGVGRMACLSFGCCYGRPVDSLPPFWRRIFQKRHTVFEGRTKKADYAHGLCGRPLVPVQAMTAHIFTTVACVGLAFFIAGNFTAAMLVPLIVTQLWRTASEFLRADYRGGAERISAYQIMAMVGVIYSALLPLVLPGGGPVPDMGAGFALLQTLPVVFGLQALFVGAFLFTGRSAVTGSELRFTVKEKEI
jgi:prolipoprotein diacylglyceryltransferase